MLTTPLRMAQGIVREVDPRGGNPSKTEVTVVTGKVVPPTCAPGRKIKITEPTSTRSKPQWVALIRRLLHQNRELRR
ncbi:hypothetical protein D7Z26_06330 [Cohnella endophytica]|uniref:Uncharacterized protein n=1 Tax=Cohnella endophytica TaxID=2419778 RepID=A0A494Y2M8_9BACL|nr:hypothetical protein D7Z26_06330 [Cohnella endophytica]